MLHVKVVEVLKELAISEVILLTLVKSAVDVTHLSLFVINNREVNIDYLQVQVLLNLRHGIRFELVVIYLEVDLGDLVHIDD